VKPGWLDGRLVRRKAHENKKEPFEGFFFVG